MAAKQNFEIEYLDISESRSINYKQIFLSLLKRWKLLLFCGILGFGAAYVYVKTILPVYKISTTLLINTPTEGMSQPQINGVMFAVPSVSS